MKSEFTITGLFYEKNDEKFRKYLDIKRVGSVVSKPDLMVVMMNPGSSSPVAGVENSQDPVLANPDNTQDQIMRVMQNTKLNFARVLNLSDIRKSKSSDLYEFLSSQESKVIDHSIFSNNRANELTQLFNKDALVIFGWGVHDSLIPLVKSAIESLKIEKPYGWLKSGTQDSYYHPLPPVYSKQLEWVERVTSQITRAQKSCAGV
jgi:hypothetical protein